MQTGWVMRYLLALCILVVGCAAADAAEVDQKPGTEFRVTPQDLPPLNATESVGNRADRIKRPANATLRVPPGFRANLFAGGLTGPRWMAVAENGDVLVSESRAGKITLLRDSDGDGDVDFHWTLIDGFNRPHGLAIHGDHLYVADIRRVWRVPYRAGDTTLDAPPQPVTDAGVIGDGHGHWTRNIAIAPDGGHFYVTIGSAGNIDEEPLPRASVQRFRADGSGQETFASGLRNPVGIAFYPGTDDLYVVVNERDGMGDELVPDYLTRLEPGGFYGWPYAYIGSHPQPGFADRRPDLVKRAIVPDLLFRSHSAPLGLVFYDGDQFPEAYRGDAFVALHGSWNAATPRGYMVVRVPFEDGRPVGDYEIFASGFWRQGDDPAEVWGRPVGLAVAADGSLLIADDWGNAVWRVSYGGE